MNLQNEPRSTAAPPFTPQPPPPGLGVLRTIILALMVFVGTVELLLLGGVYLAVSGSLPISQTSVTSGQSTGGSLPRQTGQAIPVSGNIAQAPGQSAPANQSGQQTAPQGGLAAQSNENQNSQNTPPLSTEAETSSGGQQNSPQQVPDNSQPEQDNPQQTPVDESQSGQTGNAADSASQGNPPVQMDPPQQSGGERPSGGNQSQSNPATIPDPDGHTIYMTKTGDRYHYDNHCNGANYYESTLEEALAKGLTPCNKCVLK